MDRCEYDTYIGKYPGSGNNYSDNQKTLEQEDDFWTQVTTLNSPEAEFKEFEPRLKFNPQLKYGWFHLKLY